MCVCDLDLSTNFHVLVHSIAGDLGGGEPGVLSPCGIPPTHFYK